MSWLKTLTDVLLVRASTEEQLEDMRSRLPDGCERVLETGQHGLSVGVMKRDRLVVFVRDGLWTHVVGRPRPAETFRIEPVTRWTGGKFAPERFVGERLEGGDSRIDSKSASGSRMDLDELAGMLLSASQRMRHGDGPPPPLYAEIRETYRGPWRTRTFRWIPAPESTEGLFRLNRSGLRPYGWRPSS